MPSATVQQIKDRLGIVEIVSTYLKLEKAGANWKAPCPFHQEKTPSFFVSPARGTYHCFGCNRGGDIVSFVQEIEGLDFLGALKVLAERAGVTLDRQPTKVDPEREALLAACAAADRFYRERLAAAPAARDYLRERGLSEETAGAWGLGFAPDGWRNLAEELGRQGYSEATLEKAGLVVRSTKPGASGRCYDRFRSRIMFPLFDSSGRVVGFSGRAFPVSGQPEGVGATPPAKYLNSPQTPIYDKSRLLYGLDRAKPAIRRDERAILVEGQFDLLLAHQAGWTNAVAVSGTALTVQHLELLQRFTSRITMAFDGDQAGLAAASRAISLGLSLGLEIKIVRLPAGRDPAELILKEPATWERCLGEATHVIDFLLGLAREKFSDRRELAHEIQATVYPYVAKLAERIDQAHFINRIAELTDLAETVIRAGVAEAAAGSATAPRATAAASVRPPLASRRERIEEKIFGLARFGGGEVAPALTERLAHLAPREEELMLEAEILYAGRSPAEREAELRQLMIELESELLREERNRILEGLGQAERAGDEAKAKEYLNGFQELSRKINDLKK